MTSKTIVVFPGADTSTVSQVGGKGLSLIQGSNNHFPVPPGFILTVAFFSPWIAGLKQSKTWEKFLRPEKFDQKHTCSELKKHAHSLDFTSHQAEELQKALADFSSDSLFAVRSSSPEEDLEGTSFAGGYETILGANKQSIQDAVRRAFASCLDYRVVVYKQENGFDITDPKIAVIIQQQIASEVAGVGFSLNPVTNNFDEIVINSNWGLGETVVSGTVTPDTFIVNKLTETLTGKQLGKKEASVFLTMSGGTETKQAVKHHQFSLSDKQVTQLSKLIIQVEQSYHKPMDIEWAFAEDKLYLLQARPITAYVPLSEDVQTSPGEKKRLYFDITTVAQGIDTPLSVTSTSAFRRLVRIVGLMVFGRDLTKDINTSVAWVASNGRLYMNFSYLFRLFGKQKVIQVLPSMDPLAAESAKTLDEKTYQLTASKLSLLPKGLLLKLPQILFFLHRAKKDPQKIHAYVQRELLIFEQAVRQLEQKNLSLPHLWDELLEQMFTSVFLRTVPLTFAARRELSEMKKMAGKSLTKEVDELELALPHNVTTEMGLKLAEVAALLPKDSTVDELQKQLQTNTVSPEFLTSWKEFMDNYGMRGPSEIDLAAPRYREQPQLLLDLMITMQKAGPEENAQTTFARQTKKRLQAYETMYQKLLLQNPQLAKKFKASYRFFETFGGYRETHKYYLIFVVDLMRQKIQAIAQTLVKEKRIESPEDIFLLSLEDIAHAVSNKQLNLLELVEKNRKQRQKFEHIHYPSLIDSRGYIPRPTPTQVTEGEVRGTPISAGVVRGKIKVLHSPTEKTLHKGEILVARSTDPGWTPLFVNAGAVILEIGGVLQHGALVAREYGLPCVAGVEHATELWKDGTFVEVDGSAGVIRVVDNL